MLVFKTTAKLKQPGWFDIQCEGCNHQYTIAFELRAQDSVSYEDWTGYGPAFRKRRAHAHERAQASALTNINYQVADLRAGKLHLINNMDFYKPCPACGYFQSWMIWSRSEKHRKEQTRVISWGAVVAVLAAVMGFVPIGLLIYDLVQVPKTDYLPTPSWFWLLAVGWTLVGVVVQYFIIREVLIRVRKVDQLERDNIHRNSKWLSDHGVTEGNIPSPRNPLLTLKGVEAG
jgi:hypothetical protein